MGKIVWLASYPKSGNTWVRAFLHNLLANPDRPWDINRLGALTGGDAHAAPYAALAGKPAEALTPEEIVALRAPVQRGLAGEGPESRFVKTHSAVLQLWGHATFDMSVTAGAIYIVRDPRDVAVSFSHHLGASLDDTIALMGRQNAASQSGPDMVIDFMGSWSQHVESWTAQPSPGLHVMRYEDMLAAPGRAFGGLVRFLGIDAPRQRLERAIRHASFKVLRHQEDRQGFAERSDKAERFFRSGTSGQWKDALSEAQAARIAADHAAQMARFGYLAEGA